MDDVVLELSSTEDSSLMRLEKLWSKATVEFWQRTAVLILIEE